MYQSTSKSWNIILENFDKVKENVNKKNVTAPFDVEVADKE